MARLIRLDKYRDKFHKGRPGVRWAFLEKFIIEREPGDPYLTRWRILHTPWFGILLHKIDGPDPDEHPHDHPWNFISIVLKGGYTERIVTREHLRIMGQAATVGVPVRMMRVQRWSWLSAHIMRRGDYHKIETLIDKPTWTLVLTGPRRGDWGFLMPQGHVPWKRYLGLEVSNKVQVACGDSICEYVGYCRGHMTTGPRPLLMPDDGSGIDG